MDDAQTPTSTHPQRSGPQGPNLGTVILVSLVVSAVVGGAVGYAVATVFPGEPQIQTVNGSVPQTLQVQEESAAVDVVEKVQPAVVSIIISRDLSQDTSTSPFDDFFFNFNFPEFQPPQGLQEVGGGSGFLITEEGLILTNRHVVNEQDAVFTVVMNDGTQYDATLVAQDTLNDIGLLKISREEPFPTVELGDSDSLKIGQTVVAIGNALAEYRNSATKGIISGIDRSVTAGDGRGSSETIEEAIQTDAAINPGNSGGPLVNLAGQVIGVNTAVSREGQLIGFAIPINDVKPVIESVIETGRIIRPVLGIRYIPITKQLMEQNDLSVDYGALIVRGDTAEELAVIPGSAADKAGLVENDIILEINGVRIDEENSLARVIQKHAVGDTVTVKYLHDGEERTESVVLQERTNE